MGLWFSGGGAAKAPLWGLQQQQQLPHGDLLEMTVKVQGSRDYNPDGGDVCDSLLHTSTRR